MKKDLRKNNKNIKEDKKKNIKDDKKKIEEVGSFNVDLIHIVYVILGVISIFCIFYLITFFVVVKEVDNTKYDDVSISVDNILAGRSLSMSEEKYYVLYYETKDEETNEKYSSIVSSYIYSTSEDKVKLYTVDMSDAFNKKYVSEESNTKPTKESDIAIKGTTLVIVENGEVVDYIEDANRIEELLK